MSLVLDGTLGITAPNGETFPESLINNSSASSDILLAIGQGCYINVSGATSVPLHVATGDNQEYEITLNMQSGTAGSAGNTILAPNNTTLTNQFGTVGLTADGGTQSVITSYLNGFLLAYGVDPRKSQVKAFTKTISKGVLGISDGLTNPLNLYSSFFGASWLSAASTAGSLDTTTPWTSLGTVTFPVSTTGRIIIRRIA